MADNFKFEVGSTYKNMKGVYEVVSVHKNAMLIRWGDGSEANTTVDLQMRILERMAFEKEVAEQKKKKEKKKSPKAKKKAPAAD
jgi:hypothetical protein